MIPTLLLVSVTVFLLIHLVPGDPARVMAGVEASAEDVAVLRAQLGLERPLPVQYLLYMGNVLRGDLGSSYFFEEPVARLILERLPATFQLGLFALLLSVLIGIPLGVLSATKPRSLIDGISSLLALAGVSVPNFWLAILLMYIFSLKLRWLPLTGRGEGLISIPHLILPGVVLAAGMLASTTRLTRASVMETLKMDYIRTARAKGLAGYVVLFKHALRPALIPVITNLGLQMGVMLGGAVLTETVFAWPGIGRLTTDAIARRDFPVIQGIVLVVAAFFVLINTLVDLLYSVVDPRIRYQ